MKVREAAAKGWLDRNGWFHPAWLSFLSFVWVATGMVHAYRGRPWWVATGCVALGFVAWSMATVLFFAWLADE